MDLEAGLEHVSEAVASRGGGETERNIPIFDCPINFVHYLYIASGLNIRVLQLVETNLSIDLLLF